MHLRSILLKIILGLPFTLTILLIGVNSVNAQTALFWDRFDTGKNKWNIVGTDVWQISTSQEFGGVVTGSTGTTNALPKDELWNSSWNNIAFDVDIKGVQGVDKNILLKFKDPTHFYEIHQTTGGVIYFVKLVGTYLHTFGTINYPLTNGITYHFKLENYNNNRFRIFVNGYMLFDEYDDAGPTFPENKIGLRIGTGGEQTEVWYDNVIVTEIPPLPTATPTETPSPTPTATPSPTASPTPTPSPTPSPQPTTGLFDLPFNYPGRPATTAAQFKSGFWNRMRAVFDHTFKTGVFRPFTGNSYTSCTIPLSCYDSHNGTDFSAQLGQEALSVADGVISYTSPHSPTTCTPERGGFGCVVVVRYPGNVYGLFAHLDRIYVNNGDFIGNTTQIGDIGETGCPGCGEHLHFGVLRPEGLYSLALSNLMTNKNWQELLFRIKPDLGTKYRPSCNYRAPNGAVFNFQDPSGWKGADSDPWSLPRSQGGCGVISNYLWKYEIGNTP